MFKRNSLRKVFWYLVLALPLLAYLFALIGGVSTTFADVVNQFALPFADSFIGSTVADLFGVGGYVASLQPVVVNYFVYFIGIELLHIVVDLLLFLPSVVQKFWEKLDKERDS